MTDLANTSPEKSQLQFAFTCKESQFIFAMLLELSGFLLKFGQKGFGLDAGLQYNNTLY